VRTFEEPLYRRPGQRDPTRREVVAGEVEAALDAADEGLVGVLFEPQLGEGLFIVCFWLVPTSYCPVP
jgi:hypothetical protein